MLCENLIAQAGEQWKAEVIEHGNGSYDLLLHTGRFDAVSSHLMAERIGQKVKGHSFKPSPELLTFLHDNDYTTTITVVAVMLGMDYISENLLTGEEFEVEASF